MPRAPREIWDPAKRTIIREWHVWAGKHPDIAKGDSAFGAFYVHLQRNASELLTFEADNKFETVRDWLAEEGLVKT